MWKSRGGKGRGIVEKVRDSREMRSGGSKEKGSRV